MTFLVVFLLITNVIIASMLIKKWLDAAPAAPQRPRGGEKPINEFFSSGNSENQDVEDQEMAERLLDRIDRKINVLRELISQADRRIESLGRTSHFLPAEMPRTDHNERAGERESRVRARSGGSGHEAASPEEDKRAKILQLRRKGLTPAQIAQEVKTGQGEVDLILNIEGLNT